jgi:hypothetical protein
LRRRKLLLPQNLPLRSNFQTLAASGKNARRMTGIFVWAFQATICGLGKLGLLNERPNNVKRCGSTLGLIGRQPNLPAHLFTRSIVVDLLLAVAGLAISPMLLILALLVRGAGPRRIVTFLPPGGEAETTRLNRRVGNVLLALPLCTAGFGTTAVAFPENAGWLVALMVLLFLVVVMAAVIVANSYPEQNKR